MGEDYCDGGDDSPSFAIDCSNTDETLVDTLFATIGDRRSRLVLAYFDSSSVDVAELDALVDYVVERETEASACEDLDADEHRERVAIALHHNHLPKLAENAFVEYDSRSKAVRYRGGDVVSAGLELYEEVEED
jgi:hypothetical protein